SIDVLGFAPGGVLLVGDGRAAQVVAIMTGDVKPAAPLAAKIEGFDAKLAGRLGVGPKDVEILDLAVNPASGRAYVAVRRQTDKLPLVLTVDGSGRIEELPLKDVEHARIPLPKGEQAPVSKVTDVAWAGNRLLASARANEEFASKIFAADGPLRHDAEGALVSAETYHVAHGKWETKAPMSVLMPFDEGGRTYVVGAFSCTPVVKYPVDAIQAGAKVKGISMIELGSGNRPIDMVTYVKDGKRQVLVNTFRFHHEKKPFGPSPFWAARFDADLLAGQEQVNEKAVRRLQGDKPATDRIAVVEAYHGVAHLDLLDEKRALVVKATAAGFDLEPLALP
ncbi:MAG TPA: hypothetical protein VEJ18_15735, partial [Planctomycetota bacterium]|nr:hypothetical protein [Planctomycetota bacterium]